MHTHIRVWCDVMGANEQASERASEMENKTEKQLVCTPTWNHCVWRKRGPFQMLAVTATIRFCCSSKPIFRLRWYGCGSLYSSCLLSWAVNVICLQRSRPEEKIQHKYTHENASYVLNSPRASIVHRFMDFLFFHSIRSIFVQTNHIQWLTHYMYAYVTCVCRTRGAHQCQCICAKT